MGKHSGHSWKEIEDHFLRDRYMNAVEAKAFGIIDEVLGDTKDIVLLGEAVFSVNFFPAAPAVQ
jgi:ATP-dependent Clp protease protease subunit